MRGVRAWIWILIAAGALFLAFRLGTKISFPKTEKTESSVVLLEKVRAVCKLVTAEGQFSEIYEYKDSYPFDIPMFTKKALIRVKANVSVGYDLGKMKMETDDKNHTLVISGLPQAEIISIAHDLDYYDLTEGFFNTFSTEDYNMLNARAKEFVTSQVIHSSLMEAAAEKRDELMDVIRYMVNEAGWEILVIDNPQPLLVK